MRRIHRAAAIGVVIGIAAGGVAMIGGCWSPAGGASVPRRIPSAKLAGQPAPPQAAPSASLVSLAQPAGAVSSAAESPPSRVTRQPAHVEPYEQTDIYAKAAGFVAKVNVDLGSRIQRGEALAELWIPEMQEERAQKQARVEEAQAVVGQAEAAITAGRALATAAAAKVREMKSVVAREQAEVQFRHSEHARFSELVRTNTLEKKLEEERLYQLQSAQSALEAAEAGVASAEANERVEQARLEQARANLTLAQAGLQVAQADLKHVEILIDYAIIRAPYDGVVTERRVHTGDFAQSAAGGTAQPLFSVMRTEPLRIVADIPESDAAWMRPGLRASLTVDGIPDRTFAGAIKRQSDRLDPKTRTLRVEIEIADATAPIRCGMYGAVEITDAQPAPPSN